MPFYRNGRASTGGGPNYQSNKEVRSQAITTDLIVTPDSGYDGMEKVTVLPQIHNQTYTLNGTKNSTYLNYPWATRRGVAYFNFGLPTEYRYIAKGNCVRLTRDEWSQPYWYGSSSYVRTPPTGFDGFYGYNYGPWYHHETYYMYGSGYRDTSCDLGIYHRYRYVELRFGSGNASEAYGTNGTVTISSSSTTTVNLGWKPDFLLVCTTFYSNTGATTADSHPAINLYMSYVSTTQAVYSAGSTYGTVYNLGGTSNHRINSITDTGFIINKVASASNGKTAVYFAAKFPS